eukprot:GFKZ01009350.1.p1 GENE.GFKZ01009350.1~~GFKZ01009350.1.p1  ORF type:complete len:119 (+),score=4.21 GFKZ01009350.1:90-446(+)
MLTVCVNVCCLLPRVRVLVGKFFRVEITASQDSAHAICIKVHDGYAVAASYEFIHFCHGRDVVLAHAAANGCLHRGVRGVFFAFICVCMFWFSCFPEGHYRRQQWAATSLCRMTVCKN